jgi:hypothetical protein
MVPDAGRRRRNPVPPARDKGHRAQFAHLHDVCVRGAAASGPDPLESMAVTLAALRSAETGAAVTLSGPG